MLIFNDIIEAFFYSLFSIKVNTKAYILLQCIVNGIWLSQIGSYSFTVDGLLPVISQENWVDEI